MSDPILSYLPYVFCNRFGQSVIQDCDYCRRLEQYAMFAAPRPLLQYIREAIVLGLLTTTDSHHANWRSFAIGTLGAAASLEATQLMSVHIVIPKNGKVFFVRIFRPIS